MKTEKNTFTFSIRKKLWMRKEFLENLKHTWHNEVNSRGKLRKAYLPIFCRWMRAQGVGNILRKETLLRFMKDKDLSWSVNAHMKKINNDITFVNDVYQCYVQEIKKCIDWRWRNIFPRILHWRRTTHFGSSFSMIYDVVLILYILIPFQSIPHFNWDWFFTCAHLVIIYHATGCTGFHVRSIGKRIPEPTYFSNIQNSIPSVARVSSTLIFAYS